MSKATKIKKKDSKILLSVISFLILISQFIVNPQLSAEAFMDNSPNFKSIYSEEYNDYVLTQIAPMTVYIMDEGEELIQLSVSSEILIIEDYDFKIHEYFMNPILDTLYNKLESIKLDEVESTNPFRPLLDHEHYLSEEL